MLRAKKSSYQLIILVLLACLAARHAAAADFWVKKPYQQWSKEETGRLMVDSPWATSVTLTGVDRSATVGQDSSTVTGGRTSTGYRSEMESNPTITYSIKFRSAEPIRQAEVRTAEIGSHYDSMSTEKKAGFDANASKFLSVKFSDRVVVSVTFHSDVEGYESSLRVYWGKQSIATLGPSVFLHANNEKLGLMDYSCKDDTVQFTFPRPKAVSPDEKISVEFVAPAINVIGQQRIFQDFSVKKMMVNGEPQF
jgi:hypothetical protein